MLATTTNKRILNEAEIKEKFRKKDQSVLDDIDRKYESRYRMTMMNILHNNEDVEECANDLRFSMWRAFCGAEDEDFPASLQAFILIAARNKAYDYYRKNKRRSRVEATDIDKYFDISSPLSTEDLAVAKEMSRSIMDFLEKSSPKERASFTLSFFFCMSNQQIADRLGEKSGTVASRLSRFKSKLWQHLVKEGLVDEKYKNYER